MLLPTFDYVIAMHQKHYCLVLQQNREVLYSINENRTEHYGWNVRDITNRKVLEMIKNSMKYF